MGTERLKEFVSPAHGNKHRAVGCMLQDLRALNRDGDLDPRANSKLMAVESIVGMIPRKNENTALG